MDFAPVVDGGEGVFDDTVDTAVVGIEVRAGEDFTIGEVLATAAVDPGHVFDIDVEVGASIGLKVKFLFPVEVIDDALLACFDFLPCGDGVIEVEESGVEDKVFVLGE